jgi:hypothetical protein
MNEIFLRKKKVSFALEETPLAMTEMCVHVVILKRQIL